MSVRREPAAPSRALLVGVAAAVSSVATLASVLTYQYVSRRARRRKLADQVRREARRETTQLPEPHDLSPASLAASMHEAQGITPDTNYDDALIREQLSRNYSFFGEEGMDAIRRSFVIVVGAGGVGSWTALMLLRSGVSHIRLIDFDQVSLSSLNRHACATLADVGRPKVVCCKQFFHKIAPWANVEACVDLFRAEEADKLLAGEPTYVVDAIDNLETKVELLKYCHQHNLRVFASMGAGAKADPSRIQISDISTTVEDPLARVVRRELRAAGVPPIPGVISEPAKDPGAKKSKKDRVQETDKARPSTMRRASATSETGSETYSTPTGSPAMPSTPKAEEAPKAPETPKYTEDDFYQEWKVPCVYSTEKSDVRLLPLSEEEMEKGDVGELAAFDDFRVRILPVLGPLPAMFGLAAATYILCDLARHRMEPLAVKGRRKLYEKLFADLNVTESRYPSPPRDESYPAPTNRRPLTDDDVPPTYRSTAQSAKGPPPVVRIPFSVNDCAYIFEEMFRGRTVVPPYESLATGQLMRWDPKKPLDYNNVVLFSRKQAREHEQVLKEQSDPAAFWGPKVTAMVARRHAEEKRMSHWR
ncbi:hypothetical protein GLX27_002091 [Malassezia furfur]|uniref:THIF-type NAD/FAD binding fold domain-containing protein n=1 Tax=Malassezia furfur TaxID=55194 RepID=A0ABY8EPE3_MALFU|nr:hypothetical protein CBS14141_003658 [Malassezia furfur]WFD47440.1 hypothetical protein GLX27_002091 [Malassezia furfur]